MAKDKQTDEELAELFKKQLPPVQLPGAVAAATEAQVLAEVAATLGKGDDADSSDTSGTGSDAAKS